MTATRTATFRDYTADLPGQATFVVSTPRGAGYATLQLSFTGRTRTAALDAATARDLGTQLLHWTGNQIIQTLDPVAFPTGNDVELTVDVLDGEATIAIGAALDDAPLSFDLSDEQVTDLAQRLIVWAGVAL